MTTYLIKARLVDNTFIQVLFSGSQLSALKYMLKSYPDRLHSYTLIRL